MNLGSSPACWLKPHNTRYCGAGEQSVRPDLAIYRHFGKILKALGNFDPVYLVFGNTLNLLWQLNYAIGQISIVVNGRILNKYLAIWSHWCWWCRFVNDFPLVTESFTSLIVHFLTRFLFNFYPFEMAENFLNKNLLNLN